jgi:regulator of sigma E protease
MMTQLLGFFGTLLDLALVVVGFSFIIFFHELGHFLAARWAGIRVLAFAIGFGPAAFSYRRGLGWRRGAGETELDRPADPGAPAADPTEYRVNWLPFGGYVKMLGQDDLDPSGVSSASDSYQSVPVWKRMVVISAGVVMNLVVAAFLFMFVFMVGLTTEPAKVGAVAPGSPAALVTAENAAALGVTDPGLKPGDVIQSVNGRRPNSFNDVALASVMSRAGTPIRLEVRRNGVREPLRFAVVPRMGAQTGLMEIGIGPAYSARLVTTRGKAERDSFHAIVSKVGLPGLEPGMTLSGIDGHGNISSGLDLIQAVRASEGRPVRVTFTGTDGKAVEATITPGLAMQAGRVPAGPKEFLVLEHLLGLTPVMTVSADGGENNRRARDQGLHDGDIFTRIGSVEYPSAASGILEIRRYRGRDLAVSVRRDGKIEDLTVRVSRAGTIGFLRGDTRDDDTLLARPPDAIADVGAPDLSHASAAASLNLRPGSRLLSIDGRPVANFAQIQVALREATADASARRSGARVMLRLELPLPPQGVGGRPIEEVPWSLSPEDVAALHGLRWVSDVTDSTFLFAPEQAPLRAANPFQAVRMGLAETHRVMMMTYITFARLFEGTVKVEQLKGPVGIAHLGTRIAERGPVWLLFFMALISVNLAVVNFLPLPIVDGGQFLFLLFEQVRGKPASAGFQNAATAAGLLLIGVMFLIVTFNDISNLFGG